LFTDEEGNVSVKKDDPRFEELTNRLTEASNKIVNIKIDQYPTDIVKNTVITPDQIDALVFLELLVDLPIEDDEDDVEETAEESAAE
jgi:hypothetical protein